jgi:hypothetical protein
MVVFLPEACGSSAYLAGQVVEVVRAVVGQVRGRQISPNVFGGVQFRRVSREKLRSQPVLLGLDEFLSQPAAMGWQSVPKQEHFPAEMTMQIPKKPHDGCAVHVALPERKKQACPAARRSRRQRADGREAVPVEREPQDRRLRPRRPSASHTRPLGKAALVEER